jgi:cbb3-type cytochrome oxidase subunit 1
LIVGLAMGLQMAISGNHDVIGAHAHANLLGWVTMALFGTYYAFNPVKSETRFATAQFWTYTGAVVVMVPSLYLLYLRYPANLAPPDRSGVGLINYSLTLDRMRATAGPDRFKLNGLAISLGKYLK